MKRNEFLEKDGLYWESDTHEWFNDKMHTNYAQTNNGTNKDALKHIYCFVTRDKTSGEYNRVVMDSNINDIVYDTKSSDEIWAYINQLKILKRFK